MTTDRQAFWRTRTSKPPKPEHVTPALRRARALWYASNPWKPDWDAVADAQKGAWKCFRERGTV